MRQGQKHQKNFSIRNYDSWESAERAATRWVRKMIRELPPEAPRKGRMTKRNSSGVVGVWATIDRHNCNGTCYEYCRWGARWPGCPIRGGIRFSVNTHGDQDAFVLACLAVKHEKADRQWLTRKLNQIKGTKQYRELIKHKMIEFV